MTEKMAIKWGVVSFIVTLFVTLFVTLIVTLIEWMHHANASCPLALTKD